MNEVFLFSFEVLPKQGMDWKFTVKLFSDITEIVYLEREDNKWVEKNTMNLPQGMDLEFFKVIKQLRELS